MNDPILAGADQFGPIVNKFGPFDASLPLRTVTLYEHGMTMDTHKGVLLHVSGAAGQGVSDFIFIILLDHSQKIEQAKKQLEEAEGIINAQAAQLRKLTEDLLSRKKKASTVRGVGRVPGLGGKTL